MADAHSSETITSPTPFHFPEQSPNTKHNIQTLPLKHMPLPPALCPLLVCLLAVERMLSPRAMKERAVHPYAELDAHVFLHFFFFFCFCKHSVSASHACCRCSRPSVMEYSIRGSLYRAKPIGLFFMWDHGNVKLNAALIRQPLFLAFLLPLTSSSSSSTAVILADTTHKGLNAGCILQQQGTLLFLQLWSSTACLSVHYRRMLVL